MRRTRGKGLTKSEQYILELRQKTEETLADFIRVQSLPIVNKYNIPLDELRKLINDCVDFSFNRYLQPRTRKGKKLTNLEKEIEGFKQVNPDMYPEIMYKEFLEYWLANDVQTGMPRWLTIKYEKKKEQVSKLMKKGMDFEDANKVAKVPSNWFSVAGRLSTWYRNNKAKYKADVLSVEATYMMLYNDKTCKLASFKAGLVGTESQKQMLLDWYSEIVRTFLEFTEIRKVEYPRNYEESRLHFINWVGKQDKSYIESMRPKSMITDTFSNRE